MERPRRSSDLNAWLDITSPRLWRSSASGISQAHSSCSFVVSSESVVPSRARGATVCGLDFYAEGPFSRWRNHLFVGALKYESVDLLTVEADRVMHSETVLKGLGRVRDVAVGLDGAVYVVLNSPGTIVRLTPIRERY